MGSAGRLGARSAEWGVCRPQGSCLPSHTPTSTTPSNPTGGRQLLCRWAAPRSHLDRRARLLQHHGIWGWLLGPSGAMRQRAGRRAPPPLRWHHRRRKLPAVQSSAWITHPPSTHLNSTDRPPGRLEGLHLQPANLPAARDAGVLWVGGRVGGFVGGQAGSSARQAWLSTTGDHSTPTPPTPTDRHPTHPPPPNPTQSALWASCTSGGSAGCPSSTRGSRWSAATRWGRGWGLGLMVGG